MLEINKVHCWDCLELMKQIPDKSVDLVLTDPPYNINLQPQRWKTEAIQNDNMDSAEFEGFLDKYFKECERILKDDSFLITFLWWSTIPEFRKILDKYLTLKSMPIRVKNNFGIWYYTRPQYEPMLLYLKWKPKVLENPISDVIKADKVLAPIHSCEKPTALYRKLIHTFLRGGGWIVFDWFWWSWGVFVASKELNCDFIWIEIEQKYVDMANQRLNQTNVSLF